MEATNEVLRKPELFLSLLVDAIDDELAFYSLDTIGRFAFLSRSAKNVIGLNPAEWIGRSLRESLADSHCNQQIINSGSSHGSNDASVQGKCEFRSSRQKPCAVGFKQFKIRQNNQTIGFAGVFFHPNADGVSDDRRQELSLADGLTKVEREVLEFVFDGRQNSSIARELNVAIRTIESRRSRAMTKLKVKSITQFVKLWSRIVGGL